MFQLRLKGSGMANGSDIAVQQNRTDVQAFCPSAKSGLGEWSVLRKIVTQENQFIKTVFVLWSVEFCSLVSLIVVGNWAVTRSVVFKWFISQCEFSRWCISACIACNQPSLSLNWRIILNRPFATNDHMVQNPPCWRASLLLFPYWDIKTKRPEPIKLDLPLF